LEEDLARRDFTINAMAMDVRSSKFEVRGYEIIDLFGGKEDLKNKIIRAVGDPRERFSEDALRMMRAVRFSVTLGEGWKIEEKTEEAIKENAFWISAISKERIRDEFLKIIMSERAAEGIEKMRQLGLLKYIIPELEEGYKVTQNKHHIYDCYEHYLRSLDYAAKKGFNMYVRLAALFHDIGKPRTKKGEGPDATFYGHEIVGAKMTAQILNRLRFPKKDIEKIVKLVRYHLFYYNPGEVGESSVRRLLRKVGKENIEELLQVRMADRIGSGVPKAEPYKLRHLRYMIEKVSRDPISVKMLKVDGNDVMEILKIKPGPKVGQILQILLEEVIEDPEKNEENFLKKEIERLGRLPDEEIKKLVKEAREKIEKIEQKRDEMTKRKYWVT
jgi:poly(A) polymerase/tRNA nucleotidyltransferase (CCA-adding enzyme)